MTTYVVSALYQQASDLKKVKEKGQIGEILQGFIDKVTECQRGFASGFTKVMRSLMAGTKDWTGSSDMKTNLMLNEFNLYLALNNYMKMYKKDLAFKLISYSIKIETYEEKRLNQVKTILFTIRELNSEHSLGLDIEKINKNMGLYDKKGDMEILVNINPRLLVIINKVLTGNSKGDWDEIKLLTSRELLDRFFDIYRIEPVLKNNLIEFVVKARMKQGADPVHKDCFVIIDVRTNNEELLQYHFDRKYLRRAGQSRLYPKPFQDKNSEKPNPSAAIV